ncbi:unnamed protein product [Cylicocyclus nassatus]|uniref:LIM zinc-binding domain-containing protein n=1 Tax=Cylicocyclus nassatus TaxID=53992 RepID=A0AA36GUW9_CYLNA|nr:unnamed protein product [Cylicocyclus nassatus]
MFSIELPRDESLHSQNVSKFDWYTLTTGLNMSAKKCAREECGKTVYPLEELKCLDKVWHKQCFKCTVCGMTLNMKNYKGYDKMPYCEPHYPKTVASVVTDTPEMRRVAENTKNQSQSCSYQYLRWILVHPIGKLEKVMYPKPYFADYSPALSIKTWLDCT